jgi:TetR/AcrR family tetracycline transcriptional repressor
VPSPRRPGQRAGLTHAGVLTAANELLTEQGVEAVTMRSLAQRLGVTPNALYSHVASKTALIDDMLDDLLGTVQTPDPQSEDPRIGLHQLMRSTYRVLLTHRDLVPLYLARQGARGRNAQQLGEIMIALLARAGVTGPPAREALRVLIVYTIGFAAFAIRGPLTPGDEPEPSTKKLTANFDSGLHWLLTGIGVEQPTAQSASNQKRAGVHRRTG